MSDIHPNSKRWFASKFLSARTPAAKAKLTQDLAVKSENSKKSWPERLLKAFQEGDTLAIQARAATGEAKKAAWSARAEAQATVMRHISAFFAG